MFNLLSDDSVTFVHYLAAFLMKVLTELIEENRTLEKFFVLILYFFKRQNAILSSKPCLST